MEENKDLLDFTIPQLLRWRVENSGDKVALREKDFGCWISYTGSITFVRKTASGSRKSG